MRFSILVILATCLFISSCVKKNCGCAPPYQVYYLKATVANASDIDCHLPVLDFTEDSVRVRQLTGRDNLEYTLTRFPNAFKVANRKVYIDAARLQPEEEFACTMLGFSYPHLKTLDVKNRD